MYSDELSLDEVLEIEAFCKNEKMHDAVKKGLLVGLYSHGVVKAGLKHDPLQNGALSLAALATNNPIPDEQLGQHIRGIWAGLNALENGFKNLESIKADKLEIKKEETNEAI